MVTVDVVVLVVGVLLPPHAESMPNPANRATNMSSRRNLLRFLKPRKQSAIANVAGKNGLRYLRSIDTVEGVVTDNVVLALEAPGMPVVPLGVKATVELGLNEQV